MSKSEFPKIIVVDCNFLVAAQSNKTDSDDAARIDLLFADIDKRKSKVAIPMPAFAEYLIGADVAGYEWMNALTKKSSVMLAPFDVAAAHECALIERAAFQSGSKRDGRLEAWQKIKIDRQIIAIAKSIGAKLIITNDGGIKSNATRVFIESKSIQDLELPESAKQLPIFESSEK